MPGSLRKMPVWLPIVILLVAMASIQGGASLAKSLFPLVGALRHCAASGIRHADPHRVL